MFDVISTYINLLTLYNIKPFQIDLSKINIKITKNKFMQLIRKTLYRVIADMIFEKGKEQSTKLLYQ